MRGVNLAIVTLAGAVALEQLVFANPTIGGGEGGAGGLAHALRRPFGPGADFPINGSTPPSPVFGLVCLVVVVALGTLVASVRRSELGQRMLAVRSNERAAAAVGIDVRGVKLTAFALSSLSRASPARCTRTSSGRSRPHGSAS